MNAKDATKAAAKLAKGLKGIELQAAIAALKLGTKDTADVVNAYRQLPADDLSDILGTAPATPKAAKKPVAKKTADKPKAKPAATPKAKTIGSETKRLILAGKNNEQVVTELKKIFPKMESKAPATCVAWYRSKMYRSGELKYPKK